MLAARVAAGLRTRHKENRPTSHSITVRKGDSFETRQVPIEQHFTLLQLPLFAPAAYLSGREYAGGVQVVGFDNIQFGPSLEELARTHDTDSLQSHSKSPITEFARMILKVAYGIPLTERSCNVGQHVFRDDR
jgi:hypothetical protein